MISDYVRAVTIRCPVTNERYDINDAQLLRYAIAPTHSRITARCACGLEHIVFDSIGETSPSDDEFDEIARLRAEFQAHLAKLNPDAALNALAAQPVRPRRHRHQPYEERQQVFHVVMQEPENPEQQDPNGAV